jgi:hypothetical protein
MRIALMGGVRSSAPGAASAGTGRGEEKR